MKLAAGTKLTLYAHGARNALGLLGVATHPPAVLWVLTQRCFYECVHCDSWRDTRPIDAPALLAVADKIAAARTRFVALSGGEPFMVKALPAIATRLKRAGKTVSINTNGHLLSEHVDWLVGERVDHVQVSVDGHTAALHDGIRRARGSFERILRGIEALKAARGDGPPRVSVCGVVMPENAGHLVALADRFAAVADAVELQPLHDSPGLLATSTSTPFPPADRPRVEAELGALAARHPAFDDGYYAAFSRFLFDAASMEQDAVDHCLPMIFNTLTIREDGACRICRYPLGTNIHTDDIGAVWNAPERWAIYGRLARNGCGAPCWTRCHIHPSPAPGRALRRILRVTA